ncbi:uncharacterized protein LOC114533753 [Dendronephthya gigantea]|uniref:uncharacterized protein LOC114533753 n=1 Tax=Dendronephthya gigantea TaxID=151771 RepID=UPI00106A0852|nr:uncharacterized protein LOC114533753 [Dendronephthya gigantea]
MPGDNCTFNQCGTNRRTKGFGLFKLPTAKDDASKKWWQDFLNILTKYGVKDNDFKSQFAADSLHVCEKHFLPEEINTYHGQKLSKKQLVHGALPTRNLPTKPSDPLLRSQKKRNESINPLCKNVYQTPQQFVIGLC